jgi:hypothetical protein
MRLEGTERGFVPQTQARETTPNMGVVLKALLVAGSISFCIFAWKTTEQENYVSVDNPPAYHPNSLITDRLVTASNLIDPRNLR